MGASDAVPCAHTLTPRTKLAILVTCTCIYADGYAQFFVRVIHLALSYNRLYSSKPRWTKINLPPSFSAVQEDIPSIRVVL